MLVPEVPEGQGVSREVSWRQRLRAEQVCESRYPPYLTLHIDLRVRPTATTLLQNGT